MKELTLEAVKENITAVTMFVDEQLESFECSMKAQMQLDVAVDELFANIANYAYPGGVGNATIQIEFEPSERMVSITFIDSGIPYDPLKKPDPDVTLSAEERSIGGLGIFLVKKTMDDMTYRFENNQNIVTIRKKI
ncbi:MAG: ATP-binding protein [Clostridia bacterium]|nr:ATP-binding protein [Clostridia bacterium]